MNMHWAGVQRSSSSAAATQWIGHLAALAVAIVAILAIFQDEVVQAVEVWWNYPAYSHCYLIIPISAWLIWGKREELATTWPGLEPRALFAVPLLLLVWIAGRIAAINEVRQFVIVALIDIAVLALVGREVFKRIAFPILYLFFLVPFGQYFIPPLQQFATRFTDIGLGVLAIPHFTEGTIIQIPNGVFEIAEACAGLRFLIATVALGALFSHIAFRKPWKIGVFIVGCVVIPLIANGLRCLGIIALAYYTNDAAAIEADHVVYGWGFNVLLLLVMILVGMRLRDPQHQTPRPMRPVSRGASHLQVAATAAAIILSIVAGPALAYWHDNHAVPGNVAALTLPKSLSGWAEARSGGTWAVQFDQPDKTMTGAFASATAGASPADLAVLYFARNRQDRSLVSATNRLFDPERWHVLGGGAADVKMGTVPVRMAETIIESGLERRIVWWTYWMDSQFTTSGLTIKLQQLKSVFFGREGAALIAVSTTIDRTEDQARAKLASLLSSLGELPAQLMTANTLESSAPSEVKS